MGTGPHPLRRPAALSLSAFAAAAFLLFASMLLRHLAYPLLWQDEGETAMYAQRVARYGYPVVHGERNVVYEFGTNVAQGVKESLDAYIGTTWGHFYFAVPGHLWAERTHDLYARTWRLRLPFALAGLAGMVVMLRAVRPALGGRRRAAAFTGLFFLLACTTISLQLHLRELRYYPLLVLLVAAVLWVHLRRTLFETLGRRAYALSLALLLVLVFNVFYSAWFALTALLGLERALAAWRAEGAGRRAALLDLLPLAAAALCVAPLLVFFETLQIASAFSQDVGLTPAGYLANLGRVGLHFLRHELLAPLLVTRAAVLVLDARAPGPPALERRSADRLSLFALGYALLACVNPLVYERYTVVLSPIVTLVFLLDAFHLADAAPRLTQTAGRARARAAVTAALVALALASAGFRVPEISGRLAELTTPVRGPLDFALPYLLDRYPRTEELVIATNYENHPVMYYLGSHVIVGTNQSNITRDRQLAPDVVLPRRRWKRGIPDLKRFLSAGRFERTAFPVADLHWNTYPGLSRSAQAPDPHRFRTAAPHTDGEALELYERVASP